MAIIKCKMCGGDLEIIEGSTVCECEYCGTKQTVPSADNEKKLTLFARAGRLLRACEFDKASGVFETIVADFPEEAEAYWGLVLCKYGIEYVDDPATGKKIPTCHRSSFDSVLDDPNFEQACENTDAVARRVYRDEARQIEELRQAILQVSGREEPYDVFISYKETDGNGERTLDSVIAQDIYKELTGEGYRVFFSRISLEDKLGTEYEPYIFAALNSAKVMIVVGTDYENFDSVWVKNEWSRFLKLIARGEKKTLIPVFRNMDAYDMPREFAKLAAQDMGKVGAMQDLVRGVGKLVGKKKTGSTQTQPVQQVVQQSGGASSAPLLERAFIFLEDGDWSSANEYCEKVLDQDPKNAQAYLAKLMAELRVRRQTDLADCEQPFDRSNNYQKAIRFGDKALSSALRGYIDHINERNEIARLAGIQDEKYFRAKKMMDSSFEKNILEAASIFASIQGWKDADILAAKCPERAEEARKNQLYNEAIALSQQSTVDSLTSAIRIMNSLGNWKDSPRKMSLFEQQLTRKKHYMEYLSKYPELSNKANYEMLLRSYKNEAERLKKQYDEMWPPVFLYSVAAILLFIFAIKFLAYIINKSGDLSWGNVLTGYIGAVLFAIATIFNKKRRMKKELKEKDKTILEIEQKLNALSKYPPFEDPFPSDNSSH